MKRRRCAGQAGIGRRASGISAQALGVASGLSTPSPTANVPAYAALRPTRSNDLAWRRLGYLGDSR
ncbi:hypothetical protein [Cerasicoccus frondis]|uniref:hypothetical protein n=1 Tax=Cerasicoccus frondis TaxID=490090 RepID=UPI0028528DE6|nr:hypothetical protein [Cerasicoccus frondis]